jgi:sugar lactone lactonase YvrE
MKKQIAFFAGMMLVLGGASAQTITQQPQAVAATNVASATFSVAVSGAGSFTYQWQFNGANLPDYLIATVAGNGTTNYSGNGGPATNASLNFPYGVVVDASGNLFIADSDNSVVRKVNTNGIISTVAGNGTYGFAGDGGAATNASISDPFGVAVDASGNLFIADTSNNRIRKVGANGIITTVAGDGDSGYSGDGGPATNSSLYFPYGAAVDASGNLFIADFENNRIRKVGANGIMTTVAGDGDYGYSGDGGAAIVATLWAPSSVAVDSSGNLLIADLGNYRVREVDADGMITTVAGNGEKGYSGDGGAATNARLGGYTSVAVDASGNLFIADSVNDRIREVGPNGVISTVAGNGTSGRVFSGDGGTATDARLNNPTAVAVDASGNLFIADADNQRIRRAASFGAVPTLVLSNLSFNDVGSYQVVITGASGSITSAVATLSVKSPLIAIQPTNQVVVVGGDASFNVAAVGIPPLSYAWYGDGTAIGGATNSTFSANDVTSASSGSGFDCVVANLYGSVTSSVAMLTVALPPSIVTEPTNLTELVGVATDFTVGVSGTGPFSYQWLFNGINPVDIITTVAGNGEYDYYGDGGQATNAEFAYPEGVAVDASGNIFIADSYNSRIRKVGTNGIITTVAGNGTAAYSGDGGPATSASLYYPSGVAVDASGNLFIADTDNERVRKVDTNGFITTVAGDNSYEYSGDGGQATNASLWEPFGVAVDASGNLFIADTHNNRVRKVGANGIITTVAGDGGAGYSGDGGPATHAGLYYPEGVAVDASGNLFIADYYNQRIRKVGANGIITTVAGDGTNAFSGDGGPATSASLNGPSGVAVDASGNLLIADTSNQRIRKVGANGIITTEAGNGTDGYSGDGGAPTNASLASPQGVAVDASGNLFIADTGSYRIQKVFSPTTLALTNLSAGKYEVVVTSPFGSVTSSNVTLTLLYPPYFVIPPANQVVIVGSNATFSVEAGGTSPVACAWYLGGAAIAGATNFSYTTNDVQSADSGSRFTCVLSNAYGSVTSAVAILTVGLPLTIAAQPTNQSPLGGASGTFGLTLSGTGPFTYQWQFNGANLPDDIITTVAGNGTAAYSGDGGQATSASLYGSVGVGVDGSGNLFIVDRNNEVIREVDTDGIITTVAGNGKAAYSGDGGQAIFSELYLPYGVCADVFGNFFIADTDNQRIRKVDTNGIITTVAGNGKAGYSGDNGAATNASLDSPYGVAVDVSGNLFIADWENARIRKVDTNGIITTVAGDANSGYFGDGGPATSASLDFPQGVAVDASGNLFIADYYNQRIRMVGTNGIIITVAGNGTSGYSGDGGPATSASLYDPYGVAVDASGNLFIADSNNRRIRKVDANGIITTVAGDGISGFAGDGGSATNARLNDPYGVAVDASGNLFIADDGNNRVRQVMPGGAGSSLLANQAGNYQVIVTSPFGTVTSQVATLTFLLPPSFTVQPASQDAIAGSNATFTVTAAGTPPLAYAWQRGGTPIAGASNSSYTTNDVQLADSGSQFTCILSNAYGSVTSAVAILTVDLPPSIAAQPTNQSVLAGNTAVFGLTLSGGGPYAYEWLLDGTQVSGGIIYTVAGDGNSGYAGDGGAATNASLDTPEGVVVDASGNQFIVDSSNNRIRKVGTNGIITTVAGDANIGFAGDGGAAISASLDGPEGAAVDASGNLFIADTYNERIRKVGPNGIITTVAGNGTFGFAGDGGEATSAELDYPEGVAVDASGNVFIADAGNQRIRKVATNGVITTVAGDGIGAYSGDGGAATNASIYNPEDVVVDATGNLFIADTYNQRIRKVATNGIITTIAGNGTRAYSGDGGLATSASLLDPEGVAVDAAGNLFIADTENQVIRKVGTNGIITTVAGNGTEGYSGDGGAATNAAMSSPEGVAVDASGNLFFADTDNQVIRKVVPSAIAPVLVLSNVTAGREGDYQVVITTPFGSITSSLATLTILFPPSFTVPPASQYIIAGSNVTFAVMASGTEPLAYAWHRDGAPIAGATNSSYSTNDVQLADSGSQFTCVLSNAYGSVTSEVAVLSVGLPPSIAAQPANQSVTSGNSAIFRLSLSGTGPFDYQWQWNGTNLPGGLIYTVAGNGSDGFSGDGGAATNASLDYPTGIAVDATGNLFIADYDNSRIRKVNTNGIIETVAGGGLSGAVPNGGDGGAATSAILNTPACVWVDASGNLFIVDTGDQRIRKVGINGIIITVAGNGTAAYSGDGGAATNAGLNNPYGAVVDASGNLLIADTYNERVRKVDTNGIITTVAGNGNSGFSGDGGAATNAELYYPLGLALDTAGNLFIADFYNDRIRKVDTNGIISTVAGKSAYGYSGDGGLATSASLDEPYGVAVDASGDLYIADYANNRIREVGFNGIIETVAGSGLFDSVPNVGDGGAAISAELDNPSEVAVDASGHLFIADTGDERIRKVVPLGTAPMLELNGVGTDNTGNYQVIVTSPYGSVTSSVATLSVLSSSAAPIFTSAVRNANGSVTLSLQTAPNVTSRVLATTNLAPPTVWLPVYTNGNAGAGGQWQFTDTNTANYRVRFYRASTP